VFNIWLIESSWYWPTRTGFVGQTVFMLATSAVSSLLLLISSSLCSLQHHQHKQAQKYNQDSHTFFPKHFPRHLHDFPWPPRIIFYDRKTSRQCTIFYFYIITRVWGVARCCLPRSPGQPQHHKYQNRIWWWWWWWLETSNFINSKQCIQLTTGNSLH